MKKKICQNMIMPFVVLCCILSSSLAACASSGSTGKPLVATTPTIANQSTRASHACSSNAPLNATGYWPLDSHGFQGIFQFLGQGNPRNAANPGISGANLEWSWAKVEPVEGQYNWATVDRDINAWTSRGKPVILRFSTGGNIAWSGSVKGSYTPGWLFANYGVPRVTEIDGTVFPLYWNQMYLQKLADFVNATAARYDTNPLVAAVEIGIGQGGETEPDGVASHNPNPLQLWRSYGYSNALWWQTLRTIVNIYEAAWKHTALALMTTSTFLEYRDKHYNRKLVEQYAVSQGLWLQINSLNDAMPSTILADGVGHLTTTIEEQKQSAASSGYPALNDVEHGIELGARYVLVFTSDLSNANNADALIYAAQQIVAPTMQDCSGSALTLSATGRVTPAPGVSGLADDYSQFFDGISGSVSAVRAPVNATTKWSLEGWVYPTVLPQTEALVVMNGADGSGGGGYGFGIAGGSTGGTGSRLVAYFPGVGWLDSGYTFAGPRQWYHVVVTQDGSVVRFYVNGVQTAKTSALIPNVVAAHFSIGSGYNLNTGTANHLFTGSIDDVATYANAISPTQVKSR